MGVQFEIIDRKNQRRFDMDKLYVRNLDTGAPLTFEQVLAEYHDGARRRYGERAIEGDYYRGVAARIWAFCEVAGWCDVEMWNDAGEDFGPSYPVVDGRCGGPFDPDPCAAETAAALARVPGWPFNGGDA